MFLFRSNDLLSGRLADRLGQSLSGQTVPGGQETILQSLSAWVLHYLTAGIICKQRELELLTSILLWESYHGT